MGSDFTGVGGQIWDHGVATSNGGFLPDEPMDPPYDRFGLATLAFRGDLQL